MHEWMHLPSLFSNFLKNPALGLTEAAIKGFSPSILSLKVPTDVLTSFISLSLERRVVLPCFCKPTNINFILSLGLALKEK